MSQDEVMSYHGWHLDKRVSLGHIVSTLTITGVVVIWMTTLDKRVTLSENNISHQQQLFEAHLQDHNTQYNEIIRRLERIDSKVDLAMRDGQVKP